MGGEGPYGYRVNRAIWGLIIVFATEFALSNYFLLSASPSLDGYLASGEGQGEVKKG